MESVFRDLIEFEKACGHELSKTGPDAVDMPLVELRNNLITEEYKETISALDEVADELWEGSKPSSKQLAEVADGLADLIYVCVGTAVRFGIDLPEVWRRVHEANMAKFGPGSYRRDDGKVMKPKSWLPPDVVGVIENQKPLSAIYGEE